MTVIEAVDIGGAAKAYLSAYPGLTGAGNPLAGGIHFGHARLPAVGAIGEMQVVTPRELDDTFDAARLSFSVRATGKAAQEVAEAGARALALAMRALCGEQVVVQTRRGDWVRIIDVPDSSGPMQTGDLGGEVVYGFDCTIRCQPSSAPYGNGLYGAGPFGG